MLSWGKIIALYTVVAFAALGRLAIGATERATFSAGQINLGGDYLNRPLVADVFCDIKSQDQFSRVWMQLAALKYERFRAVGKIEKATLAELVQLRAEHRTLMMNRNGTGQMDDSVERSWMSSGWSMAVTQNITRQADLRARLSRTAGRWDANHPLSLRYQWRQGKKVLVRLELPETRVNKAQVAYR